MSGCARASTPYSSSFDELHHLRLHKTVLYMSLKVEKNLLHPRAAFAMKRPVLS